MTENGPDIAKGPVARMWAAMRRPSSRYSIATLMVVGGVFGALLIWGGGKALKATDSTAFCLSCHEMQAFAFESHKQSRHFANRSGVRAECADCHVPQDTGAYLVRKVRLVGEVWSNWQGTIATRERYDANRLEMAQRVWADMEATGSRECKSCHSHEAMAAHEQSPEAAAMMKWAVASGTHTCISCHKGVAHQLPIGWDLN